MDMNRRSLLTFGAAGALTLTGSMLVPANAYSYFEDVPDSRPFAREINWLYNKDIVTGTYISGKGRYYYPSQGVNRDAMAAFLYRVAGTPNFTPPANSPFRDVPVSRQFYKEICWLRSKRITTGYGDGTFRPWDKVRRDSMAAFLYRLAGSPSFTLPSRSPFRDITPRTQFYKEMCWLRSTGISEGYGDGTFRPKAVVTRDAMAAFLERYMTSTSLYWPRNLTRDDMKTSSSSWDLGPATNGAGVYFTNALRPEGVNYEERKTEILVPQGARKLTFTLGLHNSGDSNRVHRVRILVNNKQVQTYDVNYFSKRKVTVNLTENSSLITFTNIILPGTDWYGLVSYGDPQFWG